MKKNSNPQCRYALLTSALQRAIEQGQYEVGSTLPSEAALCKQFNVSRCTVRESLRQLRAMRLIASRQGAGSVVIANKAPQHFVQSLDSTDEFFEFLRQATPKILKSSVGILPKELAESCGLKTNQQHWLHIQLVRYWGTPSLPTLLSDMYIDAKFSGVQDIYNGRCCLNEAFDQMYNIKIGFIHQDIQAIALNQQQSRILKSQPGQPALQAIRRCFTHNDDHNELLVISSNISAAERYTYSTRLRIAPQTTG